MTQDFSKHIKKLLKQELPGARSHLKMIPPGRKLSAMKGEENKVRNSSVLFLLFPVDGKLYTCLTKRNQSMKNHPGQISFPGGKVEPNETPETTALREAEEEVGISPNEVQLLGRLSELYIHVSNFSISPFIGWIDYKPNFILNRDESEKLILFPIHEFIKNPKVDHMELDTVTGPLTVPYYPFEEEIVWGATAMILTEFLDLLSENGFTLQ